MRTAIVALLLATAAAGPAVAQDPDLAGRVTRVEKELRAVQRKVFPGANPDYFDPQLQAAPAPPADTGTPAGSVVSDLGARVGALEAQVRQLTNQSEINNHRLDMVEQGFARMKADTDDRLGRIEGTAATASGATPGATLPAPARTPEAVPSAPGTPAPFGPAGRKPPTAGTAQPPADGSDTMGSQAASPDAGAPLPGSPPAATGDPAEDTYMAGYTLWSQKRYAEAEAKLKEVVAKYPSSRRASYAQNLLGRAYMDDGQLSSAADAFLVSYQKFPRGERAADSLYYLGVSLTKLKKAPRACQVYDELRDVYGATMNATLKTRVAQGRADAKCGA